MLMSTQANRYAHQLLDARAKGELIPPLSANASLSLADSYDIVKSLIDIRTAQGETMIGRKIGFTNRKIWSRYGIVDPIRTPIWTPIFDATVRYTEDNRGIQSLQGALQPRIGPELVFRLGKTPAAEATIDELAECIEWMAHAFEIVVCPFPDWKFEMVDSIAAFGLHGSLIIGEPKVLSAASRRNLGNVLAHASLSLSCGDELRSAGFGSDVLGSPLHALWHLYEVLKTQPQFPPLSAGEIITTGTWTDVCPIKPGETWTSAFSGVSLSGLTVSFV
ncbi:MAG TPA: fumarylacetoacetate hydrolase family protein [Noviherbaspirillum sp.]|uniref:2-keto-4-pentenoate hydratase n=1 Tax=Noviherbaspirillum sp. TaxID=1926288 RepID=UPI002B4A8BF3|nr:fumarylacetoacetate hydrolase family protein [Noviherbaspirillum sp.]HJV84821.1 fumarylacetoacetate hydrolase family protein [Noviherbaspirillum sp.]